MHKFGNDFIKRNHPNTIFKMGYHAIASMHILHLHVISIDMNSPFLKTKKHWNSFTTDFFLDSNGNKIYLKKSIFIGKIKLLVVEIIENLRKHRKILLPSRDLCDTYLKSPLKCHMCQVTAKNMPELKRHILSHLQKDDCLTVQ